ncbi:matrixin family metalloprotease [Pediococcus parvulus]
MKHRGIVWVVMLVMVLYLLIGKNYQKATKNIASDFKQQVTQVISNINPQKITKNYQINTETSKATTKSASKTATPIESVVQGHSLANVYYYQFATTIPSHVKKVFEQAIREYNRTGIVKLVAGKGTQKQNQIFFSIYNKKMTTSNQGTIELGHGGPEVIQQTGVNAYTVNHAKASLNVRYAESVQLSVAVHELGHALGLDHSSNRNSVMYPVDQGKTRLSSGDLEGLKAIYQGNN